MRRLITREEIDAVPDREKFGCHKHVSKLMNLIEILGGFDRNLNGSLTDQIYARYESPEEVAQILEASQGETKEGNPKKFRLWADIRLGKIRTGAASVTPLEAQRIWEEARSTLGQEFADLFTPSQLVKTHPRLIVEKALTQSIPFGGAMANPIMLLRILAELCATSPPEIRILDPDAPRLTDQGDGRSEGFELVRPLPILAVDQRFVLDIRINREDDPVLLVFEYANDDIARSGDNQSKLAIPMRYHMKRPHGVWVMKNDDTPLQAGKALGQFGFCAMTLPASLNIAAAIGVDPDADHWTRDDMQALGRNLCALLAKGDQEVGLTLLDYEKRPA